MARELGRIRLAEALELTILIARKEPKRLPRVAVRWLERYLQECEADAKRRCARRVRAIRAAARTQAGVGERAAVAHRVVLGGFAELRSAHPGQ
jgi:hypothetical protein